MEFCYCGSNQIYSRCCGQFHNGDAAAQSALELMKSRYAAFATGQVDYILRTEKLKRPNKRADLVEWCRQTQWLKLKIIDTSRGGSTENQGTVTFEATYLLAGKIEILRETSVFKRIAGQWIYVGV